MTEIVAAHPEATQFEIWSQDEARVGQQGRTGYVWWERGETPRGLRDAGHQSTWIIGAVCPARDTGVALMLPWLDTGMMNLFLAELSQVVTPGAHGIVLMDRASWHNADDLMVPANLSLIFLPPYSSGRVSDWRGGGGFRGITVGRRLSSRAGASIRAVAPFPVAARQTGRAVFPHPAFTCNLRPSPSAGSAARSGADTGRASRRDSSPGTGDTRCPAFPSAGVTNVGGGAR